MNNRREEVICVLTPYQEQAFKDANEIIQGTLKSLAAQGIDDYEKMEQALCAELKKPQSPLFIAISEISGREEKRKLAEGMIKIFKEAKEAATEGRYV